MKVVVRESGDRAPPDTKSADTVILDFLASRTVRHNSVTSYPVCGVFVLAAQMDYDSGGKGELAKLSLVLKGSTS